MLIFTDAGRSLLSDPSFTRNSKEFRIEYNKSGCPCAGGLLTMEPGGAYPTDVLCLVDDYWFAIDPKVMKSAQAIVVDASGGVPVLSARKQIRL